MLHRFHSLASDDVLISQSVKALVYLLNWRTAAVAEKRKSKMLSLTFLSNTWRRDMKENMWERFKFIGVRNLSMKSYEKSFFLLEVSIFHKVGESCAPTDQSRLFKFENCEYQALQFSIESTATVCFLVKLQSQRCGKWTASLAKSCGRILRRRREAISI